MLGRWERGVGMKPKTNIAVCWDKVFTVSGAGLKKTQNQVEGREGKEKKGSREKQLHNTKFSPLMMLNVTMERFSQANSILRWPN